MKYRPRFAHRYAPLVLMACFAVAVSTGAAAKKKDKDPEYLLSQDFRAAARNVQAALDLGDTAAASGQVGSLDALAITGTEKYAAAALRMQLAAKLADPQAQRRALTAMLESGGAPRSEIPYLRYLAGYFSYQLNDLKDCLAQLEHARQLGYRSPQLTLLLADANLRGGKMAEGLALVSAAITQQRAVGGAVGAAWYDRAAAYSYKMKDWPGLASWYRQKLTDYPSPENWRTAIINGLDNPALTPAMKLDLYRLLAANSALASERDYHAYAGASAQNGQYGEAKAVIEGARASGKLTAADVPTAAILKTATARAAKDKAALATRAAKAANAAEAADGYLALGDYAKAAGLYRTALTQAPADAGQVNARLGIALVRSGDVAGGKQILSAVTGPWADIAQFWLLWSEQKGVTQPAKG